MHDRKTVLSVILIAVFVMALCAVGQTSEIKPAETRTGEIKAVEAKTDLKKKPSIVIDSEAYVFPTAVEGAVVNHDYIVTNKGNDVLKIEGVRPSCGCTAADYTREIPPGGKGKISIKFDTRGYSGKTPEKHITVATNDPERLTIGLKISGPVESFADISKNRISFKGKPGDMFSEIITVTPREKFPFKVLEVTPEYGQNVNAMLETDENPKPSVYRIKVINLKRDKGGYFDRINIKTDSPVMPMFYIAVNGFFEDPADAAKQQPSSSTPPVPSYGTSSSPSAPAGNSSQVSSPASGQPVNQGPANQYGSSSNGKTAQ